MTALLVAVFVAALAFCYFAAKPALFLLLLSPIGLVVLYAALTPAARREVGWQPVAIALGLPVAAWLLPNVAMLFLLMMLVVPVLARRVGQIAPLYLFGLFILPGLDLEMAIGSLKLFDFGVQDALGCGAAAWLLMNPRRCARVPIALDLPVLALLAVLVAALSRDTSATNALRVLFNIGLDGWLPYYIVSRGVRDMADARRCMLHLAAAAAVLSVILVFEAWKAWPIYNILYERFGVPVTLLVKSRGGLLRASGPFLEATSLAMVLVFCFLAACMARDAFRSRAHHLVVLALLLLGMVPPQSRGAWLGVLTGLILIDVFRARLRQVFLRVGLAGLAGVLVLAFTGDGSPGSSDEAADTVDYRGQLLARGLEELRHSPLTGFPLPEVKARLADMTQGEGIVDFVNSHLFVALIAGGIGLIVFNAAFVIPVARLWWARRSWRQRGAEDLRAAAFAFAAVATPIEMLAFTSFIGRAQAFMFAFMGLASALVVIARRGAADQRTIGSSSAVAISPAPAPVPAATNINSSSLRFSRPARPSAHQL